jgi:hypothetical protein
VRADDGSRICKIDEAWRSACKRAGFPGRLFHDFRRTAVRNGLPTAPDGDAPEFVTTLPVVDGTPVNTLLDEEEKIEAQIAALRQRISAIREEVADQLAPGGLKNGFARKYVRRRKRENLRSDAAILTLMRWLGALRLADHWAGAYRLFTKPLFGWKPTAKLFRHKMQGK